MVITRSIMIQMVIVSLLLAYISDHDKRATRKGTTFGNIDIISTSFTNSALIMPPVKLRLKALRMLNAMLGVIMTEDGEQMCS